MSKTNCRKSFPRTFLWCVPTQKKEWKIVSAESPPPQVPPTIKSVEWLTRPYLILQNASVGCCLFIASPFSLLQWYLYWRCVATCRRQQRVRRIVRAVSWRGSCSACPTARSTLSTSSGSPERDRWAPSHPTYPPSPSKPACKCKTGAAMSLLVSSFSWGCQLGGAMYVFSDRRRFRCCCVFCCTCGICRALLTPSSLPSCVCVSARAYVLYVCVCVCVCVCLCCVCICFLCMLCVLCACVVCVYMCYKCVCCARARVCVYCMRAHARERVCLCVCVYVCVCVLPLLIVLWQSSWLSLWYFLWCAKFQLHSWRISYLITWYLRPSQPWRSYQGETHLMKHGNA